MLLSGYYITVLLSDCVMILSGSCLIVLLCYNNIASRSTQSITVLSSDYNTERELHKMSKIICITTSKGGAAKTTNSFEIAGALHVLGKKVLVIDLDQTCGITNFAGLKYNSEERTEYNIKTSFELLAGTCTLDEAILEYEFFDIIVGDERFAKAESTFTDDDDPYLVKTLLEMLDEDEYDYIILDHGPQNDIIKKMCYIAADQFFITTFKPETDREEAKRAIDEIIRLQKQRNNKVEGEIIGCILSRIEKASLTEIAELDMQEKLNEYNEARKVSTRLFSIRKSIKLEESQTYKTPYCVAHKSAPVSRDIYEIAEYITSINE